MREERNMRHREQGMTFIGLICLLALVGLVLYAGIRLVPVYINYMKIVRAMEQVASDTKGDSADPASMHTALERHWTIEDISTVQAKDVEVVKDDDGMSLHVEYDQSVPYLANVSLTAHFDKTVKVGP
jgi:hypothetical protein